MSFILEKDVGNASHVQREGKHCAKDSKYLGYNNDGGYAEYVNIQGKRAVKITGNQLEAWAGVPVAYVTAWNALVTKGKMTAKDTVVIWGASGGLGYAALSIAKAFGAKVIGIVGLEEKIEFLKKKGFEDVEFIIRDSEVGKRVRELTNREGADLVLDRTSGGRHLMKAKNASAGRQISILRCYDRTNRRS